MASLLLLTTMLSQTALAAYHADVDFFRAVASHQIHTSHFLVFLLWLVSVLLPAALFFFVCVSVVAGMPAFVGVPAFADTPQYVTAAAADSAIVLCFIFSAVADDFASAGVLAAVELFP
jgi:hypothetical protein